MVNIKTFFQLNKHLINVHQKNFWTPDTSGPNLHHLNLSRFFRSGRLQAIGFSPVFNFFIVACFLIYASLFYFRQQTFISDDLGRHLANGRLILSQFQVPSTNLYSFTQPDLSVQMHHWGAGLVYYLIVEYFGFPTLTLFSVFLHVSVFFILIFLSRHKSSWLIAVITAFIALPLITNRNMIRPESFSYFFFALTLAVLELSHLKKISSSWLWFLPLIQLLWINLHIFFFIGILLQFLYIATRPSIQFNSTGLKVLIASFTTSLINPYGLSGIFSPLVVHHSNSQFVTENLNLFTYLSHFHQTEFIQFLVTVTLIFFVFIKRNTLLTRDIFLLSIFAFTGLYMVRLIVLFGLVFTVFGSSLIQQLICQPTAKIKPFTFITIVFLAVFLIVPSHYQPFTPDFGLGIKPQVNNAAQFFLDHQFDGPIFNNFNAGGYLIFHLYPRYQVFIDNRPEAYTTQFISQYSLIDSQETVWRQLDNQYRFQTIFLSHHPTVPELTHFLSRRLMDPAWKVVYHDYFATILQRQSG